MNDRLNDPPAHLWQVEAVQVAWHELRLLAASVGVVGALVWVGLGLAVSGGFYVALSLVTLRHRRATGQGSVEQARRGVIIYGVLAAVGVVLAAVAGVSA